MNPLTTSFAGLTDPRIEQRKLYPLESLIFITISATVAGADTWVDVAEFAACKKQWLCKYVHLPEDRTPSHDTIGDFFKRLNPKEFGACFIAWTSLVSGITQGELIAIDGKRLRGSFDRRDGKAAIHMVSAWACANEIVLGQIKVNDKSNEITAIPALLKILELKGAIVSIDAMGCQKEIAEEIIEHGADYILAVKDNQKTLCEQVQQQFKITTLASKEEKIEKNHGRMENRTCSVITNLNFLDEADNWKGIKSVIRIESKRTDMISQTPTNETRYYISSLIRSAKQFNELVRNHWHIETKLHWTLDVVFNEDLSRVRKGYGDENFSILRRIALNLIRLDKTPKISQRNKRNKSAWNDQFLEKMLRI